MVGIMGVVSDVLHRLGTEGAGAQSLCISINTRYFFDDVSIKTGAAGLVPGSSQQLPVLQDPFRPPTAPDSEPRGTEPVGRAVRPQCTRSGQMSTSKCSTPPHG